MPRANHNLMERELIGAVASSPEDDDIGAVYDAIRTQENSDKEQERIGNLRQLGQEVLDKCGYAGYGEITV
mgnify:CR=1 FL=1